MSAELKPCPFCGGVAEQQNYVVEAVVHCTSCYAVIRRVHARDVDTGIDESASAWDTRAPQWLPIESAPRDGSWIVIGRAGHGAVLLAFWHRLHSAWWGQGGDDGQWKTWQQATHWQPLPAPPEVQS